MQRRTLPADAPPILVRTVIVIVIVIGGLKV
jgi:hypothetical protein